MVLFTLYDDVFNLSISKKKEIKYMFYILMIRKSKLVYLMYFDFQEAITLLDPLTNDSVNFVRQGALIASAMILIQQTEGLCPKVSYYLI